MLKVLKEKIFLLSKYFVNFATTTLVNIIIIIYYLIISKAF